MQQLHQTHQVVGDAERGMDQNGSSFNGLTTCVQKTAVKELIPIIIATLVWGPDFAGKRLLASCDNAAVVSVLNSRYSRDKDLMQLLRCLFFIEAYYHFSLSAHHIAGTRNVWADDLSRNRLAAFKTKVPHADPYPTPLPPPLLQWLINPNLDWTSPSWMQQLTIFVKRE